MNKQELDLMEEKIERAIIQSKRLLNESRKNSKTLSIIESQKDKINARIKTEDIKPIENGYVLKNGNKLTLVPDMGTQNEKTNLPTRHRPKNVYYNNTRPSMQDVMKSEFNQKKNEKTLLDRLINFIIGKV